MNQRLEGIGMTSRRTRERMVARLREQGIKNQAVFGLDSYTGTGVSHLGQKQHEPYAAQQ